MPSTERIPLKRQRDWELDSIYMFGDMSVSVIIDDDGNTWFKADDLAKALELEKSIYRVIDKKYCKSFEELTTTDLHIPNLHPKTTFIDETGMNMLILRSGKPKAEAIVEWVCGAVVPSIRRTNMYEIEPDDNPYKETNNKYLRKQTDELKRQLNNSDIERKALQNDLSKCIEQNEIQRRALQHDLRQNEMERTTLQNNLRQNEMERTALQKDLRRSLYSTNVTFPTFPI